MSRINLADHEPSSTINETLEDLIPRYAMNKDVLDTYTKICKEENEQIKATLVELKQDEYSTSGYKVKRIVAVKESMNEAKLLEVLRNNGIDVAIKTKEYVDMDALEAYLYNNMPSTEFARQLESCRTTTETVQLRLSKIKAKKENDLCSQ